MTVLNMSMGSSTSDETTVGLLLWGVCEEGSGAEVLGSNGEGECGAGDVVSKAEIKGSSEVVVSDKGESWTTGPGAVSCVDVDEP